MLKILIVDDNVGIRSLIREVLQEDGYMVEECGDGCEAWIWIRQVKYDLILLDVKLPGLNGVDLLKKMREEGNETGVMIMTAYEEINTAADLERLGLIATFAKPFDIRDIQEKVNLYMRSF